MEKRRSKSSIVARTFLNSIGAGDNLSTYCTYDIAIDGADLAGFTAEFKARGCSGESTLEFSLYEEPDSELFQEELDELVIKFGRFKRFIKDFNSEIEEIIQNAERLNSDEQTRKSGLYFRGD